MENQNENYQAEYAQFLTVYEKEQMDGEKIGIAVVKMVQHFIKINMAVAAAEIAFNKIAAETVEKVDENTGKLLSVAKAEILMKNTEEANILKKAKIHKENVEQIINALKALQKGALNEMAYVGNA